MSDEYQYGYDLGFANGKESSEELVSELTSLLWEVRRLIGKDPHLPHNLSTRIIRKLDELSK